MVCVCVCSYMKVHDQNTLDQSMLEKQPPVIVDNGKLCLAVWAERGERENSTELPDTHMSAAMETLWEILISARFMYAFRVNRQEL